MYDSDITAADLISEIKDEIDIAAIIPDSAFIRWLNTVEQTVYTELIREMKLVHIAVEYDDGDIPSFSLPDISLSGNEDPAIFDDIIKVYVDGIELDRVSLISGMTFDNLGMYYKNGERVMVKTLVPATEVTVIYVVRPIKKTIINGELPGETVKLPAEWLEIAASRLRGEAYKLANDDNLAAKWLNDYNLYLEQFKVWLEKNKVYGER